MLLMVYRSAEHEATGYSSAKLMFGQELQLPVELDGLQMRECLPLSLYMPRHYTTNSGTSTTRSRVGRKDHYDRSMLLPVFREGQLVWMFNTRKKKELSIKLGGLYTVVNVITYITFRVC